MNFELTEIKILLLRGALVPPSKINASALGKNKMTRNEFFIESSCAFYKESVNYSLDDTLKLLAAVYEG